jgi:hypothetical protein
MPAEGAMTRVTADWHQLVEPEPRVDAKVKELSEMTIGRTDDPENPFIRVRSQLSTWRIG